MAHKMMTVADLPEVVLVRILSYLEWEDKLSFSEADHSIDRCLRVAEAWPVFMLDIEPGFIEADYLTKAEDCVRKYGRYIQSIQSYICGGETVETLSITKEHGQMFKLISQYCSHLKTFSMEQTFDGYRHGQHSAEKKELEDVLTVLSSCKDLRNVKLFMPCETEGRPKAYLLLRLIRMELTDLVSLLDLSNVSWIMSQRQKSFLLYFRNLKELSIQKWNIDSNLIVELSKRSLVQLNIFQEKETIDDDLQPSEDTWNKVLALKPDMRVNIMFDGIILLKTMFPVHMPLREIALHDISNILTKGMMDHFAENYHNTLESFRYMNLHHEQAHTGDNRLPFALVSFARKCIKLQSVIFEVPVSSTTVLMVAKARKLDELKILKNEVSYEFDWEREESTMSPDLVHWLKRVVGVKVVLKML